MIETQRGPDGCPCGKTLLLALLVLLSLAPALLVLEWVYRAQLVDTYRPELHTFNRPSTNISVTRGKVVL